MKKLTLILALLISVGAYSQIDTEFWFAAPDLTEQHSANYIQLCFISFGQAANIVISQPAITDPTDPDYMEPVHIFVPSNSFRNLDLQPYKLRGIIEIVPRRIVPHGILITSDTPISAYYAQTYNNSEIYALKGRNALGTDFLVPMQNSFSNGQGGFSSIELVATEDNTVVSITTLIPTFNFPAAGTNTITLNMGEAYAVRALTAAGNNHLQNTRITSTKPIAVNSSDDSVDRGGQDLMGDQLVPINLTGDKYIAIKNEAYIDTYNIERVYVFALEPNTDIYFNNTFRQTINPGDVFMAYLTDKTTVITSAGNKNFVVFQMTSSTGSELGGTMLPKVTCTGSMEIAYRQAFSAPTINILVKTEYIGFFSVNGTKNSQLRASDFKPVPGDPTWSYCSKSGFINSGGIIRIKNDSVPFHVGIMDSSGSTFSYGYFSDYSSTYLLPQSAKPYYTVGEIVRLSLYNAAVFENVVWTTPDGSQIQQNELIFPADITKAGIYQVTAVHRDGCPIDVYHNVVVHIIAPESEDIVLCEGESADLTAVGYAPYEWKSGTDILSTEQTISVSPTQSTVYTVSNYRPGANIIYDGGFDHGSFGNPSDYTESATAVTNGSLAITTNAKLANPVFSDINDHTTGNDNLMVVKCDGVSGKKIWTKKMDVERDTDYELSAWFITAEQGGQPARLQFAMDGQPVGDVIIPPASGTQQGDWQRFSCTWNSGSRSSVDVGIETAVGILAGAGVCIDDIYFSPLFERVDTFKVEVRSIQKPVITGTTMEKGETELDAGTSEGDVPYLSYYWYTAAGDSIGNEQIIIVTRPGEYFVEVSDGYCTASDSFKVDPPPTYLLDVQVIAEIEVCEDEPGYIINYQINDGYPDAYSIFYGDKAQQAGFVNILQEILPVGELIVPIPAIVQPNVYEAEVQFFNTVSDVETAKLPIRIMLKYNPDKVMKQKWNDVIALYNENYNGGYFFTAYQWYRNGEIMPGENATYIYLRDTEFDLNDRYSALLTRSDGVQLFTCDFIPERRIITKPFPTLVSVSQTIPLNNNTTSGTVSFSDTSGRLYSVQSINTTNQSVRVPGIRGLFILNITSNEMNEQYMIVVK